MSKSFKQSLSSTVFNKHFAFIPHSLWTVMQSSLRNSSKRNLKEYSVAATQGPVHEQKGSLLYSIDAAA